MLAALGLSFLFILILVPLERVAEQEASLVQFKRGKGLTAESSDFETTNLGEGTVAKERQFLKCLRRS